MSSDQRQRDDALNKNYWSGEGVGDDQSNRQVKKFNILDIVSENINKCYEKPYEHYLVMIR